MLLPEQGKIWPKEAFDYPKAHESCPDGDLSIIGLMLSTYMAGHPHKPTTQDLVEWVKGPEEFARHQRAALREFVDSWTFFDLWTFYFNSGCSLFEISNAMRVAGAMAPLPVHYINSVARGYNQSGEGPDDWDRLLLCARLGVSHTSFWRGFVVGRDSSTSGEGT